MFLKQSIRLNLYLFETYKRLNAKLNKIKFVRSVRKIHKQTNNKWYLWSSLPPQRGNVGRIIFYYFIFDSKSFTVDLARDIRDVNSRIAVVDISKSTFRLFSSELFMNLGLPTFACRRVCRETGNTI